MKSIRGVVLSDWLSAKRSLSILAILMTLAVAGCGSGGGTPTPATTGSAAPPSAASSAGKARAEATGCTACHSATGSSGVGPTWKGLAGAERSFTDGSKATADDAYLKESILKPNAKVVKGYSAGIMPQTFGETLNAEQIDELVAYIKTLK